MRKRNIIAILSVIALIMAFLLWFRHSPFVNTETPSDGGSIKPPVITTNVQLMATGKHKPQNENALPSGSNARSTVRDSPFAREQRVNTAIAEMNRPVNFWGTVVDQDGAPLGGVQIEMSLRQWVPETTGGRFPTFSKETDAGGRFELTGESGDVLEFVSIKKDGYRLSPKAMKALNYEKTSNPPTAGNPVIFKMWKITEKEALVTGSKFFGIIPDGRVYTIDLINGTKAEGKDASGDLRVSIMRPAAILPHQHYDWSFRIEGVNGGVQESQDDFMYLAPESGYQPLYQTNYTLSQEDWGDQFKKEYFFRTRGGTLYGRLAVEVISDYNDQSVFSIKYALNPNGSRSLEGSVP